MNGEKHEVCTGMSGINHKSLTIRNNTFSLQSTRFDL